jgi:hypothetical protein
VRTFGLKSPFAFINLNIAVIREVSLSDFPHSLLMPLILIAVMVRLQFPEETGI